MRPQDITPQNPRVRAAVAELQGLIATHYPAATVDVEDTDEVVDTFIDRLLEIQVEQQLPVYVIPVRPLKRVLEELEQPHPRRRLRIDPEELVPPAQP